MENKENMISYYAGQIEQMTGKKVVLMGEDIIDGNGLFLIDNDLQLVRKDKYFIAKDRNKQQ